MARMRDATSRLNHTAKLPGRLPDGFGLARHIRHII